MFWIGLDNLFSLFFCVMAFFCIGVLFGNLNALAMEPLGHIAGTGSAVVGAGSTIISVVLGTLIGQAIGSDVLPLLVGFLLMSLLTLGAFAWVDKKLESRA
jgi:DHA1 family bicyclomycin/chloramphenicol resistance-like MFS transporter